MKRIFWVLIGAVMVGAVHAQLVEQGEPAVVYYSPKTDIVIDFSYEIEEQEAGVFAEFAEAMLGVNDAVKETKATYTLKDARILTATTTDYSRPHKVVNDPAVPLLLSINEKQLLCGYNTPQVEKEARSNKRESSEKERVKSRMTSIKPAPYPEEVLKAANPLAQANAVAQQIFHLREMRTYLLSGEVEKAPADGRSMELVLAELDKQEQALTELFVGKKSHRTAHKEIRFEPSSTDQKAYFSAENGFTDAENIDAEQITMSTVLYPQRYVATEEDPKAKKKPVLVSQIVYNLPGSADVKVVYKGHVLAKRTIAVAQLGVDVPLAKDLFAGKDLPIIVFNEKTGNIQSISK